MVPEGAFRKTGAREDDAPRALAHNGKAMHDMEIRARVLFDVHAATMQRTQAVGLWVVWRREVIQRAILEQHKPAFLVGGIPPVPSLPNPA